MAYQQQIKDIIAELNRRDAEILAKRIAVTFTLGYRKAGAIAPLGNLQKDAIQKLAQTNLGAIQEFNAALGKQMEDEIKSRIEAGGGYEQVRKDMIPYIEKTFGKDGTVTIDRTGQTRTVIEVQPDGSLQRVEKTIQQPYSSSIEAYSDMLSRTVAHSAYEKGRAAGYQSQGLEKWRFVGPNDERARPWHVELLGNIYEYGTDESDMAEEVLSEPNCRHRAIPFFDNPKYDTPQEFFDKMKSNYLTT